MKITRVYPISETKTKKMRGDHYVTREKAFATPDAIREALDALRYACPQPVNDKRWEQFLDSFTTRSFGFCGIEIERTWTVDVTIYFDVKPDWDKRAYDAMDAEGNVVTVRECKVAVPSLNWPATGRDLPTAQACVALYQEALNFASLVYAVLTRYNVAIIDPKEETE